MLQKLVLNALLYPTIASSLPLTHTSPSSTFLPLKSRDSSTKADKLCVWVQLFPLKIKQKTRIEVYPTQSTGLAPKPITCQPQISPFGDKNHRGQFNIKPVTLLPMYGFVFLTSHIQQEIFQVQRTAKPSTPLICSRNRPPN